MIQEQSCNILYVINFISEYEKPLLQMRMHQGIHHQHHCCPLVEYVEKRHQASIMVLIHVRRARYQFIAYISSTLFPLVYFSPYKTLFSFADSSYYPAYKLMFISSKQIILFTIFCHIS